MRSSSYAFARKLGLHPRRRLHWHSRRVRLSRGNAARWRYMKGCFLLAPANANTQRGDPCPHGTEHVFAQKLAGAACITSTVMRLLERSASVQMRSSSYVFARKLGLSYRCLAPSHPRRRLHCHSRRVRSEQGQCSEVALHERLLLARASKCKHAKGGPLPARYRACFCAKAGRSCLYHQHSDAPAWRYMKGCFLLAPANANTHRRPML